MDAGTDVRRPPTEELIDNLDDDRIPHLIFQRSGRLGYWFTINDRTVGGTQSPPESSFGMSPGGANGSAFAAHLSGNGFTNWGIYMGFTLNKAVQGPRNDYDAGPYQGISFWGKLGSTNACTGDATCRLVRVNISTRETDPAGGVCTSCQDHFGKWVTLTNGWQKHVVSFQEMAQVGWGVPGPMQGTKLDPAHVYEIQFLVQPAGKNFDFWIDDVAFVLR